jgi:hypothetical protein
MEIGTAVGNDSKSRYCRLQIGVEVTIPGGLGPRRRSKSVREARLGMRA